MLREYEFTYIAKTNLSEPQKEKLLDKYEKILTKNDGQILKKEDWGVKKIAFPIKKQFRGHYWHYDCVSHPSSLAECERLIRIDENILRYLLIKINDNVDIEARKAELAKESTKQTETSSHFDGDDNYYPEKQDNVEKEDEN